MPETAEEKAAREQAEADAATALAEAQAQAAKDQAAAAAAKKDDGKLGDGGKAALDAERRLRRDAEKQAKDEKARADALEAEKLSDAEKLEKRATDAESALAKAQQLVRTANLTQALSTAGYANPSATARLLDGVQYDEETHAPTNLDDAVKAAKTAYGEDVIRTTRRPAANINGGSGGDQGGEGGPRLTAEELSAAKSAGMGPDEYAFYRDNPSGIYKPEPAKT
jgi:colicin import membrane protein